MPVKLKKIPTPWGSKTNVSDANAGPKVGPPPPGPPPAARKSGGLLGFIKLPSLGSKPKEKGIQRLEAEPRHHRIGEFFQRAFRRFKAMLGL